jgi:hypothetical protein
MPRYWGEGPHEMYHRKEDGLWYFPGSINGYETLEEAKEGYRRREGMLSCNSSDVDSCLAVIAMIVSLVLAFIIIVY